HGSWPPVLRRVESRRRPPRRPGRAHPGRPGHPPGVCHAQDDMRTLRVGLGVAGWERSLAFYTEADAATSPDGSDDIWPSWLRDPDGYRIELVQWPIGHPDGMSQADLQGREPRD